MSSRFLAGIALLFPIISSGAGRGIREIDFTNADYPFALQKFYSVPGEWHWLSMIPEGRIRLTGGKLKLDSGGRYLQLMSVTYGDLDNDGREEAAVDLLFSTGGTANWDYLYVFKTDKRTVAPVAILESGSRADGGLVQTKIAGGLLQLDFADSDRREGDCCSRGVIRVRYKLQNGRFVEIGSRQKDSIRSAILPLPTNGPETVGTKVNGQDINLLYTDGNRELRFLTSSGVNTQPNLSSDKNSVVFVRKVNKSETEIWVVHTDASDLKRVYAGPFRWNGKTYPSSSIRWPQWSADGQAIYFVTDFDAISGALWRLDLTSHEITAIIPDAVNYAVIQTGRYRGFIVANQRAMSEPDVQGSSYPVYPFFVYEPSGKRVQQVGGEEEDLDVLVREWEGR